MMNGIAPGPLLVLLVVVVGSALLMALIGGRRRGRGGRLAATGLMLLLLVAGLSLFFLRVTQSRAKAEYENAVAMRDHAIHQEILHRQGLTGIRKTDGASDVNCATGSGDEHDAADPDESGASLAHAAVLDLDNEVRGVVDSLESEIKATAHVGARQVEVRTHRPGRSVSPVTVNTRAKRSGFPDRSPRAQLVTAILMAGVVLAGYFFLNANTRGHYTWRLRIGSTLVFAASLAVILLITMN